MEGGRQHLRCVVQTEVTSIPSGAVVHLSPTFVHDAKSWGVIGIDYGIFQNLPLCWRPFCQYFCSLQSLRVIQNLFHCLEALSVSVLVL